ncbi:sel1 repeat family protein [Solibacillus sp. MA9]|uniref:Sel1 repeat family protein n=1 Tax=Solibacillus palustris TaxID=2908203 RepID=A0ABS9UIH0_9BACL|nr:tetratricopeptide repeat protein [Solibacillus sp. MA9]MCH7323970.1 sel1 repeat family protein [Solibacillus sp. MA9]
MQTEQQFNEWLYQQNLDKEYWLEHYELSKEGALQSIVAIALLYKAHKHFEHASLWLQKAVALGHVEAMYELGNVYFEMEEEEHAFMMYARAAQLGHPDAMNNLADMYLNGEGTVINEQMALQWFVKAAENGVVEAMFTLGMMYEQGIGSGIDEQTAIHYYVLSANGGDVEGLYRMGMIYFEGELGQQPNLPRAIQYFEQAAEQLHIDALFNLGYIYELEWGMGTKAIHYYKQASFAGDLGATKKLVDFFERTNDEQLHKWQQKLTQLQHERK